MSKANKTQDGSGMTLYKVVGADDSIYLSRTGEYLKRDQQIQLTDSEAELLLGLNLVEKIEASYKTPFEQEN